MGTLGDLLVLGEGPSIVADADVDLLDRACGDFCYEDKVPKYLVPQGLDVVQGAE